MLQNTSDYRVLKSHLFYLELTDLAYFQLPEVEDFMFVCFRIKSSEQLVPKMPLFEHRKDKQITTQTTCHVSSDMLPL